jgi:hypothetical protein
MIMMLEFGKAGCCFWCGSISGKSSASYRPVLLQRLPCSVLLKGSISVFYKHVICCQLYLTTSELICWRYWWICLFSLLAICCCWSVVRYCIKVAQFLSQDTN